MDFKNIEQANSVARAYSANNDIKNKASVPERQSPNVTIKDSSNNKAYNAKTNSGKTSSVSVEKRKQNNNNINDGTREISQEPKKVNEEIQKMVDELNDRLDSTDQTIKYEVHDKTNTVMIRIVNKETDEVIREVPKESDLDALADVLEKAGMMFDEKR